MTSIAQAAMAASVLVGMVSIPAASQSLDGVKTVSGDLPNVSASESSPREAVTEVDQDSFRRTVETPFNEFSTVIQSGSVETSLENPGSRLSVQKSPEETVWTLESSSGTLEIMESPDKKVETVETAGGTLEVTVSDGDRSSSFTGSDREAVEKKRNELLNLMERKKKQIQDRRKRMERNNLPDIKVIANESTASGFGDNDQEFVVLVNNGRNPVSLDGWSIEDTSSQHEFDEITVESRERVRVYSGDVDAEISGTAISWNDDGDEAVLRNSEGKKIDDSSY